MGLGPRTHYRILSAKVSAAGTRPTTESDRWLTANSDSQADSQRDGLAWIDVDNHATLGALPNSGWT